MEYAVIETGGKQYVVSPGVVLEVEKLAADGAITFDRVLLHVADGEVKIGTPYIEGVAVSAKLVEQIKGEKIYISKFRAKSRHRRVTGHRQHLSKIQIEGIATKTPKKEVREKTVRKVASKAR